MNASYLENIVISDCDIPEEYVDRIHQAKAVAWDIETSGLDWRNDRIGICQLCTPGAPVAIVRIGDNPPRRLQSLLSDPMVKKVFHHAMFDLKFMTYQWGIEPQNVACTKIASKLLDVENSYRHSLQLILERYLHIKIDKDEQLSDWTSLELTREQIAYAAKDVMYLLPLLEELENKLKPRGLLKLAYLCFQHIPVRIKLEILGYGDIYSY